MPSKRRAAWLVVADPETIGATEQRFVDALIAGSSELAKTIGLEQIADDPKDQKRESSIKIKDLERRPVHVEPEFSLAREFSAMVRCQQADRLDPWLATAKDTALAGFANGIARDLAAIWAALSLPWSTGPVEGQISHLKTIKRSMCGRAKFDLLRHRVLGAA